MAGRVGYDRVSARTQKKKVQSILRDDSHYNTYKVTPSPRHHWIVFKNISSRRLRKNKVGVNNDSHYSEFVTFLVTQIAYFQSSYSM